MTYTYDPTKINDAGLNQMRFELGDCLISENERYLSDEEICAALSGRAFKRAKLFLVESLLARFSYEVDTKIHEAEWKLSDRIPFWRKLRDDLKEDLTETDIIAPSFGFSGRDYVTPIFSRGMHDVS